MSRLSEDEIEEGKELLKVNLDDEKSHDEGAKRLGRGRSISFLVLVLVFIAPLIVALVHEGIYHQGTRPRYLPADPSVRSVLLWLFFSYGLYMIQRKLASFFQWKMNEKPSATHKEDIFRLTLLNILLCVVGRVGARIDENPIFFFGYTGFVTLYFCLLFEMVKICNIEFTSECISNPYAIFFAVFLFVVIGALAINHLSLIAATARAPDTELTLLEAISLLIAVISFHVVLSFAPGNSSAHWHHWYGGFLGALFCVFDTFSSRIAQAMLIGIYLHGAALFGIEPCFSTDSVTSSPSISTPSSHSSHERKISPERASERASSSRGQ